jgi:hypothetical protein
VQIPLLAKRKGGLQGFASGTVKKVWSALGVALEVVVAAAGPVDGVVAGAVLGPPGLWADETVTAGLGAGASVAPSALAEFESGERSSCTMALHLGVGVVALSFAELHASSSPLIR